MSLLRWLARELADLVWLVTLLVLGPIAGAAGLVETALRAFGEGGKQKGAAHV